MRAIGLGVVLLSASQAWSQDAVRPETAPAWAVAPRQAPVQAQGQATRPPTIIVERTACQWLKRHAPSADVAYTPGVDVNRRPVAPADLPGSADIRLPERIEVGITALLAERFGVPLDATFAAEAYLGTVTVQGNRVLFNGQPVNPAAEEDLVALCRAVPAR